MKKEKVAPKKNEKVSRIASYGIDYLIIVMITSIVAFYGINTKLGINYIILSELPINYRIIYDIIAIIVSIIFIVLVPIVNKGRTIGKSILKIEIISDENEKISISKILLRQGVIIFLFGGLLNPNHIYLFDFISIVTSMSFSYVQAMINSLSIFCVLLYLFNKGNRSIYDILLKLNIQSNK